jgi:DNA-binding NarL/FixJ family response regulator
MKLPIRIFLIDRHAIVRVGLRTVLAQEDGITVVGEASHGDDALRQAAYLLPDVVLMDWQMADADGLELLCRIRQIRPTIQVIILTECIDERCVRHAIQAGAIGYLLKDVMQADLVRAVRAAARGEPTLHSEAQRILMRQAAAPLGQLTTLTQRELDVLRLITEGKRNKEIAAKLYLTEGTVKGYISAILQKLSVVDRTQAALYAVKHGLVAAS